MGFLDDKRTEAERNADRSIEAWRRRLADSEKRLAQQRKEQKNRKPGDFAKRLRGEDPAAKPKSFAQRLLEKLGGK